ncbi:MAG TPA: NAD-dependent epimerase/dehydratase family protein, partial [Rhizomicrobium sp.]
MNTDANLRRVPGDGRRAFVTGGSGFVGSNLISELVRGGWQVSALHRADAQAVPLAALGAAPVRGDITVPDSVLAAMPDVPNAVFHVAGDTSLWSRRNAQQDAINIGGTRAVVDAALARHAGRFVHTSTCSAYGRTGRALTEDAASVASYSTVNYERSKWQAEREVRRGILAGLNAVIVNPFAILGPGDRHGWARLFIQIRNGEFKMAPPGFLTVNHVREVVRAHIAAVDCGRCGENYLLGGAEISLAGLAIVMAKAMGLEIRPRIAPVALLRTVAAIGLLTSTLTGKEPALTPEAVALLSADMRCASDKADRELGYHRIPVEECVDDAYRWLSENL